MIRRGKLVKNTAIALAIISVFGSTLSSVSAAEIVKNTGAEVVEYDAITAATTGNDSTTGGTTDSESNTEDNLNITLRHLTEDKDSSGNRYLQSSVLKTVGEKKYIVMTFNNGSMFTAMQASIKGKDVETTFEKDEEKDIVTVEFEISSLADYMELSFSYNTPIGAMTHSAKIQTEENKDAIKVVLRHLTEDKDSSGNRYLQSSVLKTVGEKKYIVMTFNSGSMFTAMQASIEGKDVETKFEKNEEKDIVTVEFEISSLADYMELSFSYNTPIGAMTHSAKIQTEENKNATKPEVDEDDAITSPTPGTGNDSNTGDSTTTPDDKNEYEDGYYQVNNIVDHASETGKDMARRLLNEVTDMEVKDGKTYLTFTINEELAGFVKDMTAKINGTSVEIKKVDDNHFTIEVPNLDTKIELSMYITMMGSNQTFDITFDKSTVKLISSTDKPSNDSNTNNNGSSDSNNNSNNSGSSSDDNTSSEDTVVEGTMVKEYTIKNEVLYDNEVGYNMVRQYLNENTKIEKIDDKMYATLTFTGVDLMKDHKVYVNGKLVNHTVVSKTSDSISIRFEISDINDDIQVQLFVVPMNKTVKFGVELLEDTLKFVKEYPLGDVEGSVDGSVEENGEENTDVNGSLPQTGSAFGSEMLLGLGGLLTASGALLRRKRK